MTRVFSGTGDDGTTGLLGEARVPKYHPQPEAYGAVDEASAAFGLARAITRSKEIASITREIQQDLCHVMAELAASPEYREKFQKMTPERVRWLERQITTLGQTLQISNEFVIFGDSESSAAFNLARTIVRRAERVVAKLHLEGDVKYGTILQYLNRLSSLCFVLALWETQKGT
ncbi:MAG: ATP:cob(I)alamin adenosyltransferase [Chloroflexi bacterium RBG_16_48_8]|nr:MAG: ATP:cob(I)alamin adenosyltransferase [Chloroflexi bacterium RBG_16_48_8]